MSQFDSKINSIFKEFSNTYYEVFHSIGDLLSSLVEGFYSILLLPPWYLSIFFIYFLCFFISRNMRFSIKISVMLFSIYLVGYWELVLLSVSILLVSMLISIAVGFLLGILMAEFKVIAKIFSPILDTMQTIPSFVYLIPSIMLLGLGVPSAILSIFIYSTPLMARLTYLGITSVNSDILEAMDSYGASKLQTLFITKLPLSIKSILLGINQSILAGLSMLVTASMVGAGGIGQEILSAINQVNLGRGLRSGLCIVLLAITISSVSNEIIKVKE